MTTALPPTAPSRGWVRTQGPCPACGHTGWCTRSTDGTVIKCQRAQNGHPIQQKDGTTAWLHLAEKCGGVLSPAKPAKDRPRLKAAELNQLIKQHQTALSPKRLERVSADLGLSIASLKAFGVGYDIERGAYSFPMYDGERKPVGIRLRASNGRKCCVPGSRNGLFIPTDYESFSLPVELVDDPHPLLLLMPEGPTDAAAARDLGFRSIGRPSNSGGADLIRELLKEGAKQEVVVVADRDETKYLTDGTPFWPGIEGALQVCERLLGVVSRVQFMLPPEGVKDIRQWLNGGAKSSDLKEQQTHIVSPAWLKAARQKLEKRKRQERRSPAA